MSAVQTAWSADGNWFWEGARWNDAISEWRLFTKLYRTVICCVFVARLAAYLRTRSGL